MRSFLIFALFVWALGACTVYSTDNDRTPFQIEQSDNGLTNLIMADGTQVTWCARPAEGCVAFAPTDELTTHVDGTESIEIGQVMVRYKPRGD